MSWPDGLCSTTYSPALCGPPFSSLCERRDLPSSASQPANLGDQLNAAGVSWGDYAEDWISEVQDAATGDNCKSIGTDSKMSSNMLPFTPYARFNPATPPYTADWNTHLQDVSQGNSSFFTKLAAGTLESVAWVQPDKRHDWGLGDVDPTSSDLWLNSTMQSIFASPQYKANQTLVIITWSNANGVYDHVPPYTGDRFGPGLRVRTLLVSPIHGGGGIDSNPYEHLSIVKLIQRRFGLPMSGGPDGANPSWAPHATSPPATSPWPCARLLSPSCGVIPPSPPTTSRRRPPPPPLRSVSTAPHQHLAGRQLVRLPLRGLSGSEGHRQRHQHVAPSPQRRHAQQRARVPLHHLPGGEHQLCHEPSARRHPRLLAQHGALPSRHGGASDHQRQFGDVEQRPGAQVLSDIYAIHGGKMDRFAQFGGINAFNFAYYNTSLQGSYLWQLAANYTLFDRFFKSWLGDSDINFVNSIAPASRCTGETRPRSATTHRPATTQRPRSTTSPASSTARARWCSTRPTATSSGRATRAWPRTR